MHYAELIEETIPGRQAYAARKTRQDKYHAEQDTSEINPVTPEPITIKSYDTTETTSPVCTNPDCRPWVHPRLETHNRLMTVQIDWIPSTDDFAARLVLIRHEMGWNLKEAALACGIGVGAPRVPASWVAGELAALSRSQVPIVPAGRSLT